MRNPHWPVGMLILLFQARAITVDPSFKSNTKANTNTMVRCNREHVKEAIALKEASDCQPIAKVPNPKA